MRKLTQRIFTLFERIMNNFSFLIKTLEFKKDQLEVRVPHVPCSLPTALPLYLLPVFITAAPQPLLYLLLMVVLPRSLLITLDIFLYWKLPSSKQV